MEKKKLGENLNKRKEKKNHIAIICKRIIIMEI